MSGRQLTLQDTQISELGKVELEALQQIAMARLQEIDISVSKSIIIIIIHVKCTHENKHIHPNTP